MANCKTVSDFLNGVRSKNIGTPLPPADLATLQQLELLRTFTNDQAQQLQQEVGAMGSTQQAISQEQYQRAQLALKVGEDEKKVHSIMFSFEGAAKKEAQREQVGQERDNLQNLDADLVNKQKTFSQLMAGKAMLDSMAPYQDGYVALTGLGAMAARDLGVRLYRVSDQEFSAYWAQAAKVQNDLVAWSDASARYQVTLRQSLADFDPSYLWAVSIGLAKAGQAVPQRTADFLQAFDRLESIANNDENRLMAAEVLSVSDRPMDERLEAVENLSVAARKMGVPNESALGVASILFLGERRDGTYATDVLPQFLQLTRSYESATLMAVVNQPINQLAGKFQELRSMFGSWGFTPSEDVELASAYLTISDLPPEGVGPKLAIISKGVATYLQYPLVASSMLTSLANLEANETLSLLEHAYEVLGSRTGPMSQSELICLAVRLLQGIQVGSVNELDATARAVPQPGGVGGGGMGYGGFYGYGIGPRFIFVPMIVTHGSYYSTYSGIGGAHPGHVSSFGGFTG